MLITITHALSYTLHYTTLHYSCTQTHTDCKESAATLLLDETIDIADLSTQLADVISNVSVCESDLTTQPAGM
jgi:hypothetical protein